MYNPVCGGGAHKIPLAANHVCGDSGFSFLQYEWSFTICWTPYNRIKNVLSASLNKTFPSTHINTVVHTFDILKSTVKISINYYELMFISYVSVHSVV